MKNSNKLILLLLHSQKYKVKIFIRSRQINIIICLIKKMEIKIMNNKKKLISVLGRAKQREATNRVELQ